ncbi:GNAT family N-acetyltransferase [Pseudidiomarina atlantica]|jgi:ribosomal protein S18 acetylase RimI-like enzyme|uniref:GNAT family N-acetyltransferase n=1 Tax=Pseudidiomarina atlantica TaxID=1517416 RepID=UPI00068C2F3C|nr:GNAT family N-acetyltransferase [Pseudidiomarina atlantica]
MTLRKTETKSELRYLVAEELKLAASLLYQAYHDDPLLMSLFNAKADNEEYEKRLRATIREELMAFWEAEQPMIGLFAGDSLIGVVCMTMPGKSFGPGRYWHWRLKMLLTAGYVSTKQLVEKESLIQQAIADKLALEHYHMLAFIAVNPRYQQQGWGDVLVRAAQQALQDEPKSQGIALLITQPEHQSLFKQHHYEQITTLKIGEVAGELFFCKRQQVVSEEAEVANGTAV